MKVSQTYTAEFTVPHGELEEALFSIQVSSDIPITWKVSLRSSFHEVSFSTWDKELFDKQVENLKKWEES